MTALKSYKLPGVVLSAGTYTNVASSIRPIPTAPASAEVQNRVRHITWNDYVSTFYPNEGENTIIKAGDLVRDAESCFRWERALERSSTSQPTPTTSDAPPSQSSLVPVATTKPRVMNFGGVYSREYLADEASLKKIPIDTLHCFPRGADLTTRAHDSENEEEHEESVSQKFKGIYRALSGTAKEKKRQACYRITAVAESLAASHVHSTATSPNKEDHGGIKSAIMIEREDTGRSMNRILITGLPASLASEFWKSAAAIDHVNAPKDRVQVRFRFGTLEQLHKIAVDALEQSSQNSGPN